ncbi:MAG TPA: type II toxin-antitoxin system VapC family toxin [Terracidiphilus sp.]|nr:type II toxin-antitoxin system VapC family toxin [Terracidiphilus sp.]
MKVAVDTNVLVRAVVRDTPHQAARADAILNRASLVAVSLPCLCEFAWVLDSVYGLDRSRIAAAIDTLCKAANVVVDQPAVDSGLAVLRAGGDFADGVMAQQGFWLGGEKFVSFDKKAVMLLEKLGHRVEILA